MNVTDLKNSLGMAEAVIGKYQALVKLPREPAEDANTRCGTMKKERDEQLRRNRNNPEAVDLTLNERTERNRERSCRSSTKNTRCLERERTVERRAGCIE